MLYDSSQDDDEGLSLVREDGAPSSGGYRDLKVYHLAHELGVAAHELSLRLPKYELYETGSQLRRSAKSVSANIVEGYGRRQYKAEFIRFLIFARASLDETEEYLRYIRDCHPHEESAAAALVESANMLGRKLSHFLERVKALHQS